MAETGHDRHGAVLTCRGQLPFSVMAKLTRAVCNLDCQYCFFLSKAMLYPGYRFRMAAGLQETYIRQLVEAHARAPEVVVAWQGGEPTMMGLDFFRQAIELVARPRGTGTTRSFPPASYRPRFRGASSSLLAMGTG